MIIGTEIVVLAAFGARFKLDFDISDLTERIEDSSQAIHAYSQYEPLYYELFTKLDNYNFLKSRKIDPSEDLAHLTDLADESIVFENVDYSPLEISLTGVTTSLDALSSYELALQKQTVVYHTQHPEELVPIRYSSVSLTRAQTGSDRDDTRFILKISPLADGRTN